ncbi:lipopolysaccharide assembly protein LapA domain-containing protein [Lysobacter sp. GX 14042]|uniref:lipopolysaccharide assembly protein LapA domain-containing protein n=1 Tax=Lysobacter sp. GX 14042 TaxID=2907155 RepID=UPI001F48E7B8|nr:lipopolysaccharide assembly protein LapA domain-containing protein [Lysobacter sp. GX 14042]MCE7031393.1 lipopolysaccharide assembly protein LapA domain-containing protein [Lysobacter sp. GX 14042]
MRLIRLLIAIACILLGALVGALNVQPVVVNLGFAGIPANLGIALIVALLLGALLGGLAVAAGRMRPAGAPPPPPAGRP